MRKRVEASNRVDASHRLVCSYRSTRDRAERRFAVLRLQLVKCVRAVFKLDQGLLRRRSRCSDLLLAIERLVWGGPMKGTRQSAYFIGNQDRVPHRLCAQLSRACIFRPAGCRSELAFLACDLGQTRRVVERMQCARESLLLVLRFRWATRLRHEFLRFTQRIAGLGYRNSISSGRVGRSMLRPHQRRTDGSAHRSK